MTANPVNPAEYSTFLTTFKNGRAISVEIDKQEKKIIFSPNLLRELTKESPNFGKAGKTVYLRSYARKIKDPNTGRERRETWKEICYRVMQYSFSLHKGPIDHLIVEEAIEFFEAMYNLKVFPAGRTMWVGGTDFIKHNPVVNMNCAYRDIDSPQAFYEVALLLMGGTGVGFGANREAVTSLDNLIPMNLNEDIQIEFEPYRYKEDTATFTLILDDGSEVDAGANKDVSYMLYDGKTLNIDVADCREGWARFYRDFIVAYVTKDMNKVAEFAKIDTDKGRSHIVDTSYENSGFINKISITVNRVRPRGGVLKRFGGTASGPEPLLDFVRDFVASVQAGKGSQGWTDTLIVDTVNLEGRSTVAGGTRRSALIALGEKDSIEFAKMKTGNWYETKSWRSQSNNSQVFHEHPGYEAIRQSLAQALLPDPITGDFPGGEPALINGQVAKRRNGRWKGFNPCAK